MKRFSLRTLVIGTALIAVLFAFPVRRALTQKRGREWVASQRGHVAFAHYDPYAATFDQEATFHVPDWIVKRVGIDYFDSVVGVALDNTFLEDLSPITDLRSLQSLAIIIEIDDDLDFKPLCELPELRDLHLDYTDISAERLADLRALLPNVRVDALNHPPPD